MEMYTYIITYIYIYTLRSDFQFQKKNVVFSFLRPCLLLSLVILQAHLKKEHGVYSYEMPIPNTIWGNRQFTTPLWHPDFE